MGIEIIILSIFVGLAFGAYYFHSRDILKEGSSISPVSGVFAVFLAVAILILFNGLWADIIPKILGESEAVRSQFIFKGFLIRSIYVMALIAGSLLIYFLFYKKGEKYSMVVLPYFVGSMIMTARWLIEVGKLIIETYEKVGIYAILTAMIVVMSFIVFYVQHKKEKSSVTVKPQSQEVKNQG